MTKVFIDGGAGTTGLRILDRLSERKDIHLLTIAEEYRKDVTARKEKLNEADIVFLCLPDDSARESVSLIDNPDTVVIDASTAHRTLPDWAYGFPELGKKFEEKIRKSKRIAVPGCHASGFIALIHPLIEAGILPKNTPLCCHSLTGYSGGGKKMIAQYEDKERDVLLGAPRQYGITQTHKHLKEMQAITGLDIAPAFCPIVADFYSGMLVTIPLFAEQIHGTVEDIKRVYQGLYQGPIVEYCESVDEAGFVSALALAGKDGMKIAVSGNADRILLSALYDNLGKGASGAAVECMNMAMGVEKTTGLSL